MKQKHPGYLSLLLSAPPHRKNSQGRTPEWLYGWTQGPAALTMPFAGCGIDNAVCRLFHRKRFPERTEEGSNKQATPPSSLPHDAQPPHGKQKNKPGQCDRVLLPTPNAQAKQPSTQNIPNAFLWRTGVSAWAGATGSGSRP